MSERRDHDALKDFLRQEWQRQPSADVQDLAQTIAAQFKEPPLGLLFYGSCLDQATHEEGVLDFYVIVSRYDQAYTKPLDIWLNRILAPNVYAISGPGPRILRAKYAVLSLSDLLRMTSSRCFSSMIWARFSQPMRLLLAKDDQSASLISEAVVSAMMTAAWSVRPLLTFGASPKEMWTRLMTESYRTELRVERAGRAAALYEAHRARYEAVTPLLLRCMGLAASQPPKIQPPRGPRFRALLLWRLRCLYGKLKSLALLSKATLTYTGGLDYLAWKIERHSGRAVQIKPWMRRVPVIAGLLLALRLRLEGTIR